MSVRSSLFDDAGAGSARTANGAVSHAGTRDARVPGGESVLLDYFAKAGTYAGRSYDDVAADADRMLAADEASAVRLIFGVRLISRRHDAESPENGGDGRAHGFGRRDEFDKLFCRLLEVRRPLARACLPLLPVFGSYKDFLLPGILAKTLQNTELQKAVYDVYAVALVKAAVEGPAGSLSSHLPHKYLPTLYSAGKMSRGAKNKGRQLRLRTDRAKQLVAWGDGLRRHLGLDRRGYRSLKAAGASHAFQRAMAQGRWDDLKPEELPGRALFAAVFRTGRDGKNVFERHGLEPRLAAWAKTAKSVPFSGYPHELVAKAGDVTGVRRLLLDRQFDACLRNFAGADAAAAASGPLGRVLVALDTSGSMTCTIDDKGTRAIDVAVGMGAAFSTLASGAFADTVALFDTTSRLLKLDGGFCDRVAQMRRHCAMGSTNFSSLIEMIVRERRSRPDVPVGAYPETILVVSDMQFDAAGRNDRTNAQAARAALEGVGLGGMRLVWWYVNGASKEVPVQAGDRNTLVVGGFEPSVLLALLAGSSCGGEASAKAADPAEGSGDRPIDGLRRFLSRPIFRLLPLPAGRA